jgi:hypothetical protein
MTIELARDLFLFLFSIGVSVQLIPYPPDLVPGLLGLSVGISTESLVSAAVVLSSVECCWLTRCGEPARKSTAKFSRGTGVGECLSFWRLVEDDRNMAPMLFFVLLPGLLLGYLCSCFGCWFDVSHDVCVP